MKLTSTFYSDDQLRIAMVFAKGPQVFMVDCLNNQNQQELKFYFTSEREADDFAEDWVNI